ncbi:MAG TPA: glycosyltransferase [Thermoanaerobaculia bacterium]|nr:glycosyltransferase [Thermoanaerobaculia bacterium]
MSGGLFLGIPVLNRLDLLDRCLGSVDLRGEIVVVNNNTVDPAFAADLAPLAARHGAEVLDQERNLGVAGSWNLILKTGVERGHEVVFLGSNDTFLYPGSLASVLEREKGPDEMVWHIHAWNFFALHARAVERVGWFDENFYPAYKEDQDYTYRCDRLAGVRRVQAHHTPGVGADHLESQTIRSDALYAARNFHTHSLWNTRYYWQKWGGDFGAERFLHPFDQQERDWRWWPDPGATIDERDWDRDRRRRG